MNSSSKMLRRIGTTAVRRNGPAPRAARTTTAFIRHSSSSSSSSIPSHLAPLASINPGPTSRARLDQHYQDTLSHDLLYLLYSHAQHANADTLPIPLSRSPIWSPDNPYAVNRAPPRPKGNRYLVPNPSYTSPSTLPALESITLQCMTKQALLNKNNLLPLMMAFEAITGEAPQSKHPGPYGPGSGRGLIVTRSSKKSASFKIRPGAPTGVKVELRGEPMYNFLETLVDFVLPRLKTFNGIPLPPPSHPRQSPSSTSGVVSFGLPPEAMGLFPQIEVNLDQYPKTFGMNIFCVTSAKGRGAQSQARALLSGMGVPFVKR